MADPIFWLEFGVGLAILILIHELGHFLACKLFKIPVEEFGLGIPPRIATLFEWGGTQFTLNAIPLGGFVRPRGETDPSIADGLGAANPWKRIVVFFAGPFMNLMGAVLLYVIIFVRLGADDPQRLNEVMIKVVDRDSPAEQAGLQVGDVILKANEVSIDDSDKLVEVVYDNLDQPIVLEVQRGQEILDLSLTPRSDPPQGEGPIGIQMGPPTVPLPLAQAVPQGFVATYRHSEALLTFLGNLVTGRASEDAKLLGLKGMVDEYSAIREGRDSTGLPQDIGILNLFISLNISLGLLNLLPIPALDGGRIFLALPEIILRRRVPLRYQEILIGVTFLLLLGLLIFINVREFFL
jgi:regulator of sigma E protease